MPPLRAIATLLLASHSAATDLPHPTVQHPEGRGGALDAADGPSVRVRPAPTLPRWLPHNPACPAGGCPLPALRTAGTVSTAQYLDPSNTAVQNTLGWKALVKYLEQHPGCVASIPGGAYDVTPLWGASGLINVTIVGGQSTRTVFHVHNATGAHVAAWSHSRGLYLLRGTCSSTHNLSPILVPIIPM